MAKIQEHIHKLRRHTYTNGTKVYFCTLDCSFKVEAPFALGKKTICNICGDTFLMNEYSVKLAKPHCNSCGKFKVIDDDGKARFVDKSRPTQAIAELGKNAVASLKDRMGKVVAIEKDEDI